MHIGGLSVGVAVVAGGVATRALKASDGFIRL